MSGAGSPCPVHRELGKTGNDAKIPLALGLLLYSVGPGLTHGPRSALFSEMYPTAVGLGRMGAQSPSGAAMEKIFR